MTYYGTTAASSLSNPPTAIAGGGLTRGSIGATAFQTNNQPGTMWWYASTNPSTEVSAALYFTDGFYLGMRPGDVVMGSYQSSAGSTSGYSYRLWVSSVTTAGASFSTGQMSTG